MVEFKLGLDIVPTPGLLTGRGINGYLSSDRTTIYVDEHLFRDVPNRYRFTLAHEVGHLVLHSDLYHAFESDDAWLKFREHIARHDLSSTEYQANTFAGLILVPESALATYATEAFHQRAQPILAAHPDFDLRGEAFWSYVADDVAVFFQVSAATAQIRLQRDGIWGKAY